MKTATPIQVIYGGNQVSEKVKAIERTRDGQTIVRMIPDDRDANNNSAGGRLPGFLNQQKQSLTPILIRIGKGAPPKILKILFQ